MSKGVASVSPSSMLSPLDYMAAPKVPNIQRPSSLEVHASPVCFHFSPACIWRMNC